MDDGPGNSACPCVKWHAPRPTRLGKVELEGEIIELCPTTFTAYNDTLTAYQTHNGKPPRDALKGIPKFPRELAQRAFTANVKAAVSSDTAPAAAE